MSMFDESDYAGARASAGVSIGNGDYIWKITGWTPNYRGKDGSAAQPCVFVTMQPYADLDGKPVGVESSFSKAFFVTRRQGETEGHKQARMIAIGALKQLVFSIKGRELSLPKFEAVVTDPSETINELVGARVAWTRRYNDPTKTELAWDRFFMATPKGDGSYVMFNGNPIGTFSEDRLGKSIREKLVSRNPSPAASAGASYGGGSSYSSGANRAEIDDEIPF